MWGDDHPHGPDAARWTRGRKDMAMLETPTLRRSHQHGPQPCGSSARDTQTLSPPAVDRPHAHALAHAPALRHEGLHVRDLLISEYDQIARLPVIIICVAAIVGIGLALALDHVRVAKDVVTWIALPGDLFINALKGLVGPLVFCSIVICIGELIELGKVRAVAGRTVAYFVLCSLLSSSIGVLMGWAFLGQFHSEAYVAHPKAAPMLALHCASGKVITGDLATGVLTCRPRENAHNATSWRLVDPSKSFAVGSSKYPKLTVTDQLFSVFFDLIPENIVGAFTRPTTMGIAMLSMLFGTALARSINPKYQENYPLLLIRHALVVCRLLVNYVLWLVPVAIISMIAGAVAKDSSSLSQVGNVGWVLLALVSGLLLLTVGILGVIFYITTRTSIFHYLKHIFPAMVFIFGCSSSIATLPINLRCVENSRQVSPALSRFVLPIGATCNLNGTAVYMPLACIFMAKVSGNESLLTPMNYALLIVVGAISSLGVAPVPHSGLVMAMTIWRTVFGMDVPSNAFTLLVSADWILDRMRAIVNITNDTIICRIIAEQCGEANFGQSVAATDMTSSYATLELSRRGAM